MNRLQSKVCAAFWLSGCFGLAATLHAVRFLFGFSLIVAGYAVPLSVSGLIALGAGVLSVLLLILGCKKPCLRDSPQ